MTQQFTEQALKEQIRQGTATADTYYLLGLKNYDKKYFLRAIELDPHHADAYRELAREAITDDPVKDPKQALAYIDKAIELAPQDWEAYQLRALLCYYTLKDPQQALADLDTILAHDPNNPDALEFKKNIEEDLTPPPTVPYHPQKLSVIDKIRIGLGIIALLAYWYYKFIAN